MDLVVEARRRQSSDIPFAGVVFMAQSLAIGLCIEQLEMLAKAGTAQDFAGSLEFLPLR